MNYIESLNWRYATKKFNSERLIAEDVLERIIESGNLTATSMGLQNLAIVNVVDPEKRKALLEHSFGQEQVVDASHLLVLCSTIDATESDLDQLIERISKTRKIPADNLAGYKSMMSGWIGSFKSIEDKQSWLAKQVYIMMGTMLTTCALERVDACPMEGFNPAKYDEVLNLEASGLKSVLVLPIGYRSTECQNQHLKKVRKSTEEFLYNI